MVILIILTTPLTITLIISKSKTIDKRLFPKVFWGSLFSLSNEKKREEGGVFEDLNQDTTKYFIKNIILENFLKYIN